MPTQYVVYKRESGSTKVRCRDGKYRTWKDCKGFGALRTCVSLHSHAGANRAMNSAFNSSDKVKSAGYISSSELSKDESFTARAIKRNRDPS